MVYLLYNTIITSKATDGQTKSPDWFILDLPVFQDSAINYTHNPAALLRYKLSEVHATVLLDKLCSLHGKQNLNLNPS